MLGCVYGVVFLAMAFNSCNTSCIVGRLAGLSSVQEIIKPRRNGHFLETSCTIFGNFSTLGKWLTATSQTTIP